VHHVIRVLETCSGSQPTRCAPCLRSSVERPHLVTASALTEIEVLLPPRCGGSEALGKYLSKSAFFSRGMSTTRSTTRFFINLFTTEGSAVRFITVLTLEQTTPLLARLHALRTVQNVRCDQRNADRFHRFRIEYTTMTFLLAG